MGGQLCFTLGGARSQLILSSSADVAFNSVPEPGAWALLAIAAAGVWRRAARPRAVA